MTSKEKAKEYSESKIDAATRLMLRNTAEYNCYKLGRYDGYLAGAKENGEQLKQAKEIIKKFIKYEINEYDGSLEIHFEELKKQAEQFLKE